MVQGITWAACCRRVARVRGLGQGRVNPLWRLTRITSRLLQSSPLLSWLVEPQSSGCGVQCRVREGRTSLKGAMLHAGRENKNALRSDYIIVTRGPKEKVCSSSTPCQHISNDARSVRSVMPVDLVQAFEQLKQLVLHHETSVAASQADPRWRADGTMAILECNLGCVSAFSMVA